MSRQASGLRAWTLQRISAVYLGIFLLVLLHRFGFHPPADFAAWRGWVATPWVSIGLMLFAVSLLLHAWVGIRDVLIDYVRPIGARVALLSLFAFLLIASGLWALQAVLLVQLT